MKLATVTSVALLAALPAAAQDDTVPALSNIVANLGSDGYRVTDVDVDADVIEVEAGASDARRVDLRLDPASGEILEETSED